MTSDYLLFKTFIEVKLENEVKDRYIDSFPAISLCRENTLLNKSELIILYSYRRGEDIKRVFKDCVFDREYNLNDEFNTKICAISYGKFVDVLNNQSLVSDFLYSIDLKYYKNIFDIKTSRNLQNCKNIFGLITSHSKDLEYFTL